MDFSTSSTSKSRRRDATETSTGTSPGTATGTAAGTAAGTADANTTLSRSRLLPALALALVLLVRGANADADADCKNGDKDGDKDEVKDKVSEPDKSATAASHARDGVRLLLPRCRHARAARPANKLSGITAAHKHACTTFSSSFFSKKAFSSYPGQPRRARRRETESVLEQQELEQQEAESLQTRQRGRGGDHDASLALPQRRAPNLMRRAFQHAFRRSQNARP